METKIIVVSVVVGLLGLLSAILDFAAESKKIKSDQVLVDALTDTCIYPSNPSPALGVASVVLLIVAQVLINVFTGCFCCKTHQTASGGHRTCALISYIFSWVTFVLGFALSISGAALNAQHRNVNTTNCYIAKTGVFALGGVFSFITAILGIVCYVMLSTSRNAGSFGMHPNQGIAMGQPNFPGQANQPGSWPPQQSHGKP